MDDSDSFETLFLLALRLPQQPVDALLKPPTQQPACLTRS